MPPWYKNNGTIIIWNDETEGEPNPSDPNFKGFTSMEIVISPLAKGNAYTNTITYDHSSDLLTMQQIFGVGSCLGADCTATDLGDLFVSGSFANQGTANIPEPASLLGLGFGMAGLRLVRRRRG